MYEFRMHISHYLQRSWAVILQQAWAMYLKDRINTNNNQGYNNYHRSNGSSGKVKENCRRFNKGKCSNGVSCKYDHRCDECGKFGHGAHICRKRLTKSKGNQSQQQQTSVQESAK